MISPKTKKSVTLDSGAYEFELKGKPTGLKLDLERATLKRGDVVIANELVQHDVDASALPAFERFEIPLLGKTRFASPAEWVELTARETERYLREDFAREFDPLTLEAFGMRVPKVVVGLVASGDQFVTEAKIAAELRHSLPGLLCLEM